jgi:hypothetical protein
MTETWEFRGIVIRPEIEDLNANQKRRVLEKARDQGITCGSCGSQDFEVGGALYLGFLFLNEDNDTHIVALTCKKPDCETPRTGIKLHEADFLKETSDER